MNKSMNKDLLIYLPAKLIEGIAGVLLISFYTRLLVPQLYDRYVLVNGLVLISYQFIVLWLQHASYRHINEAVDEESKITYISTMLTSVLILQGLYVIVVGLLYVFIPAYRNWLFLSLLWFAGYSGIQFLIALLAAHKKALLSVIASSFSMALKLVMTLVFSRWLNPWYALVLSHSLVDLVLVGVILNISNYRSYWRIKRFDRVLFVQFLKYGFPLIGLGVSMAVINISDRFLIDYFLKPGSAGIYQANYGLASAAFTMIMIGIMRAVYPNLLRGFEREPQQFQIAIWQGFRLYALLAIPATCGLVMLSGPLSKAILAPDYVQGQQIMAWVALSMFTLGATEYVTKPLELHKNPKPIFYAGFIAAIVNVILNVLLLPKGTIVVAAQTTLVSYIVYFAVVYTVVSKRYTLHWEAKSILNITLATAVMGLFLGVVRQAIASPMMLIAVVMGAILIYGIALSLTKELNKELTFICTKLRR